jgi:hypothetical protein
MMVLAASQAVPQGLQEPPELAPAGPLRRRKKSTKSTGI